MAEEKLGYLVVFLIVCGAFCNIVVVNSLGVNLRLPTVAIGVFLIANIFKTSKYLSFFKFNQTFVFVSLLYFFVMFLGLLAAPLKMIACKQQILYIFLFANIYFFWNLPCNIERFYKVFFLSLLIASSIVNVYSGVITVFYSKMGYTSLFRPSGFFEQANTYGSLSVMMYAYFFSYLSASKTSSKAKLLSFLSIIILTPIFVIGNNRGSIIATILLVILNVAFLAISRQLIRVIQKQILYILIFLTVIPIGFQISKKLPGQHGVNNNQYEVIIDRFTTLLSPWKHDESYQIRLREKNIALDHFYNSPLIGVGLGNAAVNADITIDLLIKKSTNIQKELRQSTELMQYDIIGETGIIGAGLFMFFYVIIGIYGWRNVWFFKRSKYIPIALGSFTALVALLINGISSTPLTLHFFWLNTGVIFYMAKQRRFMQNKENSIYNPLKFQYV